MGKNISPQQEWLYYFASYQPDLNPYTLSKPDTMIAMETPGIGGWSMLEEEVEV